jgi:hypothetical protein
MNKAYFVVLLSLAFLFFIPLPSNAAQSCHWINSQAGDDGACQRMFGESGGNWARSGSCSASTKTQFDNTCCCPVKKSYTPIIVGSLVVILGTIAILSFVLKKNETA